MERFEEKATWRKKAREWLWAVRARVALRSGVVHAWGIAQKEPAALAWAVQGEPNLVARAWLNARATQTALWVMNEKRDPRAFFLLAELAGEVRFESPGAARIALERFFDSGTRAQRAHLARVAWLKLPRALRGRWGSWITAEPGQKELDWREAKGADARKLRELTWRQILEEGRGADWASSPSLIAALDAALRGETGATDDVFPLAQTLVEFASKPWRQGEPAQGAPGSVVFFNDPSATFGDEAQKTPMPREAFGARAEQESPRWASGLESDPFAGREEEASALAFLSSVERWLASQNRRELATRLLCALRFIAESRNQPGSLAPAGASRAEYERLVSLCRQATVAAFAMAQTQAERGLAMANWKHHQKEFLWSGQGRAGGSDAQERSERFLWACAKEAWGGQEAADAWKEVSGSAVIDALAEGDSIAQAIDWGRDGGEGGKKATASGARGSEASGPVSCGVAHETATKPAPARKARRL